MSLAERVTNPGVVDMVGVVAVVVGTMALGVGVGAWLDQQALLAAGCSPRVLADPTPCQTGLDIAGTRARNGLVAAVALLAVGGTLRVGARRWLP